MRSPEWKLIDKLEEIKKQLAVKQPHQGLSLSPADAQKNLFSLAQTMAENESTVASPALMQEGIQITLSLVRALMVKAEKKQYIPQDDIETLVDSFCKEHPSKEIISILVYTIFFGLLRNYREFIEQFCGYHGLVMPADKSHIVMVFRDEIINLEEKVTLFRLKEMKYALKQSLAPFEDLAKLHPIRDLPYLRHLKIKGSVVKQIIQAKAELLPRLTAAIEAMQHKLRSIILEKGYREKFTAPADLIEQQNLLLISLEKDIEVISFFKKQLKSSGDPAKENEIEKSKTAHAAAYIKIALYPLLNDDILRLNFELSGTDLELLSQYVPTERISDLGARSKSASRLGVIEKLVEELSSQMKIIQLSAGESYSDMGLSKFVRYLNEEANPFESRTRPCLNKLKFLDLLERFKMEAEAGTKSEKIIPLAQTSEMTQGPRAAGGPALFTQRLPREEKQVEALNDSSDDGAANPAGSWLSAN